jgi:hypothetical protein
MYACAFQAGNFAAFSISLMRMQDGESNEKSNHSVQKNKSAEFTHSFRQNTTRKGLLRRYMLSLRANL